MREWLQRLPIYIIPSLSSPYKTILPSFHFHISTPFLSTSTRCQIVFHGNKVRFFKLLCVFGFVSLFYYFAKLKIHHTQPMTVCTKVSCCLLSCRLFCKQPGRKRSLLIHNQTGSLLPSMNLLWAEFLYLFLCVNILESALGSK